MRTPIALTLIAGAISLSACAAGESIGVASPAYAGAYSVGPPGADPTACWTYGWAGSFDYPYCGWYNGFFYPGSGIYVYDRSRNRRSWTPDERNHWATRAPTLTNGMHSPGPVRIPGASVGHGFGGRGFGGHGFGGGRGSGGAPRGGGRSGR